MKNIIVAIMISAVSAYAQTRYEYNGLVYTFPSVQSSGVLTNDGTGVLSWTPSFPTELVAFNRNLCFSINWNEASIPARGRYVVGRPAGGTLLGTVGTALGNIETRNVSAHTHAPTTTITVTNVTHTHNPLTDPGHTHVVFAPTSGTDTGSGFFGAGSVSNVGAAATGVSFAASASGSGVQISTSPIVTPMGSTFGIPAPYIQVHLCRRPA